MYRFLEVAIALVLTVVLFVIIALFLPASQRVERSVELTNPIVQISDALQHFKLFTRWQQLTARDPRALFRVEGPEFGEGARIAWTSRDPSVGNGSLTITEVVPEEMIRMAMQNDWRGNNKRSTFKLEFNPQTNATTLRWIVEVDYGWDLIGRYAGLYLNGEIGDLIFKSLGRFRQLMAQIPQVDYSQVDIRLERLPETPLVYVGASTPAEPRLWDDAEIKLDEAWREASAFITRNNIEVAGPRRLIINVLGEQNNDFNAAFPVKVAPESATGNVRVGSSPAGPAIMATARGHRVGTARTRDMLRAYAMTHGYDFNRDLVGLYEEWREPDPEDPMQAPLTTVVLPLLTEGAPAAVQPAAPAAAEEPEAGSSEPVGEQAADEPEPAATN
jgi:uncharacterized protein YndB with AHSA1/START domain